MRKTKSFQASVESLDSRTLLSGPTVVIPAALGNGITNAQPTIQRAINSLAATGGTVYVPPGTYELSSTLYILWNNITLTGAGKTLTQLRSMPGVNPTQVTVGVSRFGPSVTFDTVENMTLNGNNNSGYYFGIAMPQGNNMTFANLTIDNESEDGIYIGNSGCEVSQYVYVEACTINGCGRNGIDVGFAQNVYIAYNIIENTPITSSHQGGEPVDIETEAAIAHPYVNYVYVVNNAFELMPLTWNWTGVSQYSYYGPISNVVVSGNTVAYHSW